MLQDQQAKKEFLLRWIREKTAEYPIKIDNFSTSWANGLAFCALIHHFMPNEFDFTKLKPENRRENFDLAFRVSEEKAGIAPLLDTTDMLSMKVPDWKCVFLYLTSFYNRFKDCK